MKYSFSLILFVITLASCEKRSGKDPVDCSLVLCASGDGIFFVKFIDKETGSDLIATKKFDTTGIKLYNNDNVTPLWVSSASHIDSLKTALYIGGSSSPGRNTIKLTAKAGTVNFSYNYKVITSGGCCPMGEVSAISVSDYAFVDYPFQKSTNMRIIKIAM